MMDAIAVLLAALLVIGFSIILFPFMVFNYRVRKTLDIDEGLKRQTIRWAVVGSVCSGKPLP